VARELIEVEAKFEYVQKSKKSAKKCKILQESVNGGRTPIGVKISRLGGYNKSSRSMTEYNLRGSKENTKPSLNTPKGSIEAKMIEQKVHKAKQQNTGEAGDDGLDVSKSLQEQKW